jgi:hypothetical protein
VSELGQADARAKVDTFLAQRFPSVRPPLVIDDPFSPDTTLYHCTDWTALFAPSYTGPRHPEFVGYYAITIPRWWDEHRRVLLIHECGHLICYLAGRTRDVVREFLAWFGGDPALASHRLIGEVMAEHFARAEDPAYAGQSYPQLAGLVPFDAARTRAFFEDLASSVPAGGPVAPVIINTPAGPAALPEISAVYYSQWDPDHIGSGDCVPTSAKMLIALYTGRVVPIGEIRAAMDLSDNGVIDLARDAGITLEAARAALTNDYGIPSTAVFARDLDLDQLLEYVWAGRLPIVFEQHGHLSGRQDQAFTGLHAVLVTGVDGSFVEVKDPDRWGPELAARWLVSIDELRRAWDAGAISGGGAVIPNEPRGGEDMFTEEDRRKLDRVYAHAEAYEGMVWTSRLQRWWARAIKSIFPAADLSGPDVVSGEAFEAAPTVTPMAPAAAKYPWGDKEPAQWFAEGYEYRDGQWVRP